MSLVISAPRLRSEEEQVGSNQHVGSDREPTTSMANPLSDPPTYAEEVGRRIVQARKERGMTQVELAQKVGVSQRSAQAWENGETIPYRKMKLIARVVKKSPEWILHGDEVTEDKLSAIERQLDEVTALLRSLTRRIK